MMRTLILVIVGIALLSAAPASAEDKITGAVTCTMATEPDAVSDKIVFDWDCIDRVAAEKPNEHNGWDRSYANLLKQAHDAGERPARRARHEQRQHEAYRKVPTCIGSWAFPCWPSRHYARHR